MRRELEVACRLAREAGALVLDIYNHEAVQVEWKTPSDPVTHADKTANRYIVDALRQEFPGDGILAEESPDTDRRLACRRVWMIDPVDGTKEFIKRNGEFSVMIGLAVDGVPTVGAVYQPTADVLYYASAGEGAYIVRGSETRRAQVSMVADPSQMCLAVSRSHKNHLIERIRQRLGIQQERESGSVGLKIGLIVEQTCDLYIHVSTRTRQWDACAPDIILREAGGAFTDLYGAPIAYNHPDSRNWYGLLATNNQAHDKIVAIASEILSQEPNVNLPAKE